MQISKRITALLLALIMCLSLLSNSIYAMEYDSQETSIPYEQMENDYCEEGSNAEEHSESAEEDAASEEQSRIVEEGESSENVESGLKAQEDVHSGSCGPNTTWDFDDRSNTLTIRGEWIRHCNDETEQPWYNYRHKIEKVIIHEGVRYIGQAAFSYCDKIKKVKLPNSLEVIGNVAFGSCYSLLEINLNDNLLKIGNGAFAHCSSLESITIPARVKVIEYGSFEECKRLKMINVNHNNLYFCEDKGVLYDKKKSRIISCVATKEGVYSVPNSVKSIDPRAFCGCESITEIIIPDSVNNIGDKAFEGCLKCRRITVNNDNLYYSSLDGVLFDKNQRELIKYPSNKPGDYEIPGSVQSIKEHAFCFTNLLSEVIIPENITVIEDYTFGGSNGIKRVSLPKSIKSIGFAAFSSCGSDFSVFFHGPAPQINKMAFTSTKATSYYPPNDSSWTKDVMQDYGGDITWKPHQPYLPSRDGWGFPAYQTNLSKEVWQAIFGDSIGSTILYNKKKNKLGNGPCHGMAISSVLTYLGYPFPEVWDKIATCTNDISFDKVYLKTNDFKWSINDYITGIWACQYLPEVEEEQKENKKELKSDGSYQKIIDRVEDFQKNGHEPIAIVARDWYAGGPLGFMFEGHVLIPYKVEKEADSTKVFVYDCNDNSNETYIKFFNDKEGLPISWEYSAYNIGSNINDWDNCGYLSYLDDLPAHAESMGVDVDDYYDHSNHLLDWILFRDSSGSATIYDSNDAEIKLVDSIPTGIDNTRFVELADLGIGEEYENENFFEFYIPVDEKPFRINHNGSDRVTTEVIANHAIITLDADGCSTAQIAPDSATPSVSVTPSDGEKVSLTYTSENMTIVISGITENTVELLPSSGKDGVNVNGFESGTIKVEMNGETSVQEIQNSNYEINSAGSINIREADDEDPVIPGDMSKDREITCKDVVKSYSVKKQSFKLNAKTEDGAKLSYKSNNKKVKVDKNGKVTLPAKFSGTVKITITADATDQNAEATKTISVSVPTVPSVRKISSGKGQITVSWKKNTTGKGYEVQYSTDKTFKKTVKTVKIKKMNTTKATIKKLNTGTRYYLRIRTVNGKHYSNWSAIKSVKIV